MLQGTLSYVSVQELESTNLAPALRTVLTQETTALFGNKTAQALNDQFLSDHAGSVQHLLAGAWSTRRALRRVQ